MEGSALPEQDAPCSVGSDSAQGPGSCSHSSLPKATIPRLSSNISSPLYPQLCGSPGQMVTNYIVHICPLRGSLCLQWYPPGSWMVSGPLSCSGAIGWGAHPHTSQGEPPRCRNFPSGTSAVTCGSPASPLVSLPHSLPVMLW